MLAPERNGSSRKRSPTTASACWASGRPPDACLPRPMRAHRRRALPRLLANTIRRRREGGWPEPGLNGQPFTVIGVTNQRFAGLQSLIRVSAFLPLSTVQLQDEAVGLDCVREPGSPSTPGHRPFAARRWNRASEGGVGHQSGVLAGQYPSTNKGTPLLVVPERYARPLPQNGPMFHVAAAVLSLLAALLLCITSANIANLLLARASSRGREIGLRSALGARRGRIVRQLLTESVVLALLGGAGAVLLAVVAAAAMERGLASLAFDLPLRVDFGIDWRVVTATIAVALTAGVISGLAPALYSWRADVNALLRMAGGARDRNVVRFAVCWSLRRSRSRSSCSWSAGCLRRRSSGRATSTWDSRSRAHRQGRSRCPRRRESAPRLLPGRHRPCRPPPACEVSPGFRAFPLVTTTASRRSPPAM